MNIKVGITLLLTVLSVPNCARPDDKSFEEQYDYILRLPQEISIGERLAAFQQLMDEHRDDPRIAEVMSHCGHLVISEDHQQGCDWFRRAAKTALPETPPWFEARFHLLGRIQLDSNEAQELFEELQRHSNGSSLILAKVEGYRLRGRYRAKDLIGVEQVGRRLMNWYRNHPVPTSIDEKADLDLEISNAASLILEGYTQQQLSKQEIAKKIDAFQNEFGYMPWLHTYCNAAREKLKKLPEAGKSPTPITRRLIWPQVLAVNSVAVAIFVAVSIMRRRESTS